MNKIEGELIFIHNYNKWQKLEMTEEDFDSIQIVNQANNLITLNVNTFIIPNLP